MASKRKRGRGLPPRPIGSTKSRLKRNLQKIEAMPPRVPPPQEYGTTMENIRKDADMMLKYAQTPKEKLKYVQIIFKVGQMYLWYPWKVGTLSEDDARDYILGKAMQAENDQYKYISIVERDNTLKKTLDKLGATDLIYKKPSSSGLKIRLPRQKPKPYREYKRALDRKALAQNKLKKFINLHKMRKRMYLSASQENKKETKREMKLARIRWERAREEYLDAKQDLPKKKKAYEEFRARGQAPMAKSFRKYK